MYTVSSNVAFSIYVISKIQLMESIISIYVTKHLALHQEIRKITKREIHGRVITNSNLHMYYIYTIVYNEDRNYTMYSHYW